ncbi:MAG: HypC/HybG/HupF family hydrogenase formation chaperone [Lentisphaeria bacterium]|nr:HypC/HybG/HupF family hydrogenase formation chaperone [Candidatus Neomarinimicrobiota bacterium]MCF7841943.1 HypC/HybG/HupF family hydrogenase formation chaperone [Lentisphaeria bacterium]
MCLAIPGKVVRIFEKHGLKTGIIDYGGVQNEACLVYVPEIELGQYTVVHAGFAISVIREDEAREKLAAWQDAIDTAQKNGVDFTIPRNDSPPELN